MATERLTGEDAELYYIDLSTELVGTGIATVDTLTGGTGGGYLRISAIGVGGIWDAALAVDDIQWDDGTSVPIVGDNFYWLQELSACDVTGWSISLGKGEIDVTTLCDYVKSYRAGKTDMSGSFTVIRTVDGTASEVTARNIFTSQFLTLITDDGAGNINKYTPDDALLWICCTTNVGNVAGDIEEKLFLPIRLTGHELSAALDSPVGGTVNFRVDGSQNPIVYQREIV